MSDNEKLSATARLHYFKAKIHFFCQYFVPLQANSLRVMRKIILYISLFLPVFTFAQDFYEHCEDTCNHVHGIDLSHYQGEVFWDAIGNNTKMAYVYLKATEGGDRIDHRYERNIELAHNHGLKVGSYHFYRPKTEQARQLENFLKQCRPEEQDLIPMIDIESAGGLCTEDFCDSLFSFLHLVEEAYGQKPLLYTYTNFYNKFLCGKLSDYQLMIAQYTDRMPVLYDDKEFIMWQYTCKGLIDGVGGYIDKSRFVGAHGLREIRYRKNFRKSTKDEETPSDNN